ncbi:MAG: 16S rRNA (cytosine(1402)-N(4))-methyltransferase RsmH [Clostridia bacterium]|nr:16S rRNA (cytosine(1402)-N(4))-methyltransferase RsmH [Clostridia bacterium]
MEFSHEPVLLKECIEGLAIDPDGIYVDGTLGGAGHSAEICRHLSERGTLIGIDRDQDAIDAASERLAGFPCRRILVKSNNTEIASILAEHGIDKIDGALLDLGVSSHQLDVAERGFSYMQDAPLDMRMDREEPVTAGELVNDLPEEELARIIKEYGEERYARRIASGIVRFRRKQDIETTGQLAEIIKSAMPAAARRENQHPAKRTFQALRIEVNGELSGLRTTLEDLIAALKPGGRLAVISFHSLEDRIVKETIARHENPCTCPPNIPVCVCGKVPDMIRINRKPITASPEEEERNPRSRSAKLRIGEKIQKR